MGEGRWGWWQWGLVWGMPVCLAGWIALHFMVFGGEWPSGSGAEVFAYLTIGVFWGIPAWSVGLMVAVFLVRRKARLLVAFGLAGLMEVVFFREFLGELGNVF